MKVYVGYYSIMYEGNSEPEEVFTTEEAAVEWSSHQVGGSYKEFDLPESESKPS